ncbi:glycosyltransferase family 2 protein [Streptomyces sp. NRRL S-1868]|uniref:glycosyltransferase family 2 protein n=1 Tax=Streptomyces sp. NRRL S-1868 TaxID=1463892 RepID=UPI00068EF84F|nr:glycosyltransferase family A protein [Streptomyces sp. NRRL S-1868]
MTGTEVLREATGSRRPRIDIICPTYNRSTAIRPTLTGVLEQSVGDWRLLVVSDASSDDTEDVVLGCRDPRIALLRSERHGHPGGPRNVGLAHARAPYIAYLDHDDLWEPHHLRTLLEQLERGAEIVATGATYIDHEGRETGRTEPADMVWHPDLQAVYALFEPARVGHVRGVVESVGGWTTDTAGFEDWDLWWRLGEAGHAFQPVLERTAVIYRGSDTRTESVRARYAIPVGRTDSEDAARGCLDALADDGTRDRLADLYAADFADWWDALARDDRFRTAPGTARAEVLGALRERSDGARTHVFTQLRHARRRDGHLLYDPAWCTSKDQAARMSAVMRDRDVRQREFLHGLLLARGASGG